MTTRNVLLPSGRIVGGIVLEAHHGTGKCLIEWAGMKLWGHLMTPKQILTFEKVRSSI